MHALFTRSAIAAAIASSACPAAKRHTFRDMLTSMIIRAFVALAILALTQPAFAGEMRVTVRDAGGRPVANAVVTLHFEDHPAGPISFPWAMRISQRNMQFDPFVLIAPSGATVTFPNFDSQRHHVYSFSEAGPFELRLFGRDETRSVRFRNVGVIAVGCNIHDSMGAFVYVVDTPFAMKTGADGVAVLSNAPSGAATLRAWHPYMRAQNNTIERAVTVAQGNNVQAFEVRLRAPPDHGHAY